jgi:hypothetical protein
MGMRIGSLGVRAFTAHFAVELGTQHSVQEFQKSTHIAAPLNIGYHKGVPDK